MNTVNFIESYKVKDVLCEDLIKYWKKNKEHKIKISGEDKNSIDVYFYNQSINKTIKDFFKILSTHLKHYVTKYKIKNNLKTHVVNKIQHYAPGQGYSTLHYERGTAEFGLRQLVYMLYLNNVDNGGTEFPYQNAIISATKGNFIIWPADFTHPHKGIISSTQEKYIVTGWIEII